jgi:hypothetical protein
LPTFGWLPRFRADFERLTAAQQVVFLTAIAQFVEDLEAGGRVRKGLRVKGIQGASAVFETTWAPDGRATFGFGDALREGEAHIIWRRVGTHDFLREP